MRIGHASYKYLTMLNFLFYQVYVGITQ